MKKKTTVLFTLAVGLLVGAAVAAPVGASIARANEGNAPVAVATYDINVRTVEGITVDVPESAEPGAVVEAVVRTTVDYIQSIDGLLVNGLAASKVEEGVFKFVMPANAVELVPQYTEVESVGQYAIRYNEGNGLKVSVQNRANEGDSVAFAITFNAYSGYTWNGYVEVFTTNEAGEKVEEVEYASLGDVLFGFEMPASDVFIEVGMEKRTFSLNKLAIDDNKDVLNAYGNMYVIEEGEEGETRNLIAGQGNAFARAEVGSLIRVELHDTEKYKVSGLTILETGEELALGENGYVEFTLPAHNINLVVDYETRYYEIDVTNSEHITIEVYHKVIDDQGEGALVLDENEKPLVQYKETVYVKAVSNDPNYGVKTLHWKAMEGERATFDRDLDLGRDGYYVFTSNGVMTSQTLVVTEVEAFADAAITINASDNLTAVLKVQSGSDYVEVDENHKIFANNKLYIDYVSEDQSVGLKEAQVQYQVAGKDNVYALTSYIDTVSGLRYVTIPEDAVAIIINISEQAYYTQFGFTGNYVGKSISTYGNTLSNNSYFNSITPWGTGLLTNYYGFAVRSVDQNELDDTSGTFTYRKQGGVAIYQGGSYLPPENQDRFTTETEYIASYSANFVVMSDLTTAAVSSSSSTINIGVRNNGVSNDALDIRFDTVVDGEDNRWYIVTSAYEGEIEGVLAINLTQGIVYNDASVTVDLYAGESIDAADALYDLSYGDETLLQLGKSGGQTVVLDGYQGVYAVGEESSLALDGAGNVVYGDIATTYSIDETAENPTVEFSTSEVVEDTFVTRNYTVVLSVAEGTAVVYMEEDIKQVAVPTVTYSDTNPFVYDQENGTYTSGNKGISSSYSYMYIDCAQDGVLSFDYVVGGEGKYDYATIKKGSETIETLMGSGTNEYNLEGHVDIEVTAGDKITIYYQKDSGGNKGIDSIVISNLLYFVNANE